MKQIMPKIKKFSWIVIYNKIHKKKYNTNKL